MWIRGAELMLQWTVGIYDRADHYWCGGDIDIQNTIDFCLTDSPSLYFGNCLFAGRWKRWERWRSRRCLLVSDLKWGICCTSWGLSKAHQLLFMESLLSPLIIMCQGEVMVDQWQHNKRLATIYSSRSVKHRVFSVCRCVVIKTNLGTIRNKS